MPDKQHKVRGDDPALNTKPKRKGYRRFGIDGAEWQYRASRGTIAIVNPEGHTYSLSYHDFYTDHLGLTEDQIFGGGDCSPGIHPSDVADYIRANLRTP